MAFFSEQQKNSRFENLRFAINLNEWMHFRLKCLLIRGDNLSWRIVMHFCIICLQKHSLVAKKTDLTLGIMIRI